MQRLRGFAGPQANCLTRGEEIILLQKLIDEGQYLGMQNGLLEHGATPDPGVHPLGRVAFEIVAAIRADREIGGEGAARGHEILRRQQSVENTYPRFR